MGRKEQREAKKKLGNPAKALLKIMQRYMPDFWKQIDEMEDPRNQSYITKAFKRLAEKLKKVFPRLPICILADGLYTTESVFSICEKNRWEYIIRLKDGAMPEVAREFHTRKDRESENSSQEMKWVNGLETEKRT